MLEKDTSFVIVAVIAEIVVSGFPPLNLNLKLLYI